VAPSWFELLSWVALGLGFASALGDIGGEWIVWATGWTIGTTALGPEYILDLPLAWTFGILFQYLAIAPARGQLGRLAPLGDAIKSDTLYRDDPRLRHQLAGQPLAAAARDQGADGDRLKVTNKIAARIPDLARRCKGDRVAVTGREPRESSLRSPEYRGRYRQRRSPPWRSCKRKAPIR
jgi:Domain of unknown function (DUF4396)